ncbi:MAG: hypothetical protein QM699_14770 [Amaricoccus sp.]
MDEIDRGAGEVDEPARVAGAMFEQVLRQPVGGGLSGKLAFRRIDDDDPGNALDADICPVFGAAADVENLDLTAQNACGFKNLRSEYLAPLCPEPIDGRVEAEQCAAPSSQMRDLQ